MTNIDLIQWWNSRWRDLKFDYDVMNETLKSVRDMKWDPTTLYLYQNVLRLKEEMSKVESIIARLKNGS